MRRDMFPSFIICALALFGTFLVRYVSKNSSVMLNDLDRMAIWETQHILFGIGMAAFFTLLCDKSRVLMFSFACIVAWELYEEIRIGTLSYSLIDTMLDVLIGTAFAMLYFYLPVAVFRQKDKVIIR